MIFDPQWSKDLEWPGREELDHEFALFLRALSAWTPIDTGDRALYKEKGPLIDQALLLICFEEWRGQVEGLWKHCSRLLKTWDHFQNKYWWAEDGTSFSVHGRCCRFVQSGKDWDRELWPHTGDTGGWEREGQCSRPKWLLNKSVLHYWVFCWWAWLSP